MTQRKRIWLIALIGVVAMAGAWWWHLKDAAPTAAGKKDSSTWTMWPSQLPNAAPTLGSGPNPPSMAPEATSPVPSPLDTMQAPNFSADAHGNLTIDQQTKNDVERVYALFHGKEAQGKLDEFSANLPPAAKQELMNLYQNYEQYAQAVAQAFPPAQSTGTIEEAKQQFVGLKALRNQFFGAQQAQAMFGEEAAITQTMLSNIETNKDPNMSLDEKVNKAQQDMKPSAGTPP